MTIIPDPIEAIGRDAGVNSQWPQFADYCALRAKGLRKSALIALDRFCVEAASSTFEVRREFCLWLFERQGVLATGGTGLPHPLLDKVVAPMLREWRRTESANPLPHYWAGVFGIGPDDGETPPPLACIEQALSLDPSFDPARRSLVDRVIYNVEYSHHHLPYYYVRDFSDPAGDVVCIDNALNLVEGANGAGWAVLARKELMFLRSVTEDWIRFESEGEQDFATWCEARGKAYRPPVGR